MPTEKPQKAPAEPVQQDEVAQDTKDSSPAQPVQASLGEGDGGTEYRDVAEGVQARVRSAAQKASTPSE